MSAPTNFQFMAAIDSEKSTVFTFSFGKAQITKFDLDVNRSRSTQGHHLYKRVELMSLTIHAKFPDHRPSGSGEEDFLRFLPYMGMAAILVM